MRVALDTNRLTDLFRGDAALADLLGKCEEVCVPLIVMGEMKAGFAGVTPQRRNERLLRAFFERPNTRVLLPGHATADQYAQLFVQLKRADTPLPDHDIWIAALALEHDLVLITRDRRFERIEQLPRA